MRKKFRVLTPLIAVFVVLILAVGVSFAVTREATWGGKSSTPAVPATDNVYRLTGTRDTSGAYITIAPTGVGITPGYEVFTTRIATKQTIKLDATDSGRRLIDNSGHAGAKYILPVALAGLEIELCTGNRNSVTLDTHTTSDTINHTISGSALDAGDALMSPGQAGDCVRVTCGSDTNWYITNMGAAAWSDTGTN